MFPRLLRRTFRIIGCLILLLFLYVAAIEINVFNLFGYSPGIQELKDPKVPIASEIYTADGQLIGKYYKEHRTPVSYDEISPVMIRSLVLTEDVRFYKHGGIDFYSLISSIWSTAKGDQRGGSTLTQQLAKNLFKTRGKKAAGILGRVPGLRALIYKSKEWITAVKIEFYYSKEEILAMYLNTVGFGNNAFGIKVASHTYFSKEPSELKLHEAALLVGMLKATSTYNPFSNPKTAKERRDVVLSQMHKYNEIDNITLKKAISLPLGLETESEAEGEDKNSYIRKAAENFISDWCEENNLDLYADGLKIYTTIDSKLQSIAEEAVKEKMNMIQNRFYRHWGNRNPWTDEKGNELPDFLERASKKLPVYKYYSRLYKKNEDSITLAMNTPKRMRVFTWKGEKDTTFSSLDSLKYYLTILQTGMMTLDPFTGHVKVWIGGLDHKYFKYDHVNQSKRQAGSTFKPFAYVAAIDNGYSPCDRFVDQPVHISYVENAEKKLWSPHNSDWVFTGNNMSLRWAMGRSCNSVTAQLTEKIGWDKVAEYAHKLGIKSPLKVVPSICLGSSDVSVYEMVAAYGTFLNTGLKAEPVLVTKITNHDGEVLAEFSPEKERVLSEETAWLMIHMLKGGMEEPGGTSQALWEYDLFKNGNEIGGKTGTSSNHADGWYMGVTKDLVTGIWVGADEPSIHFRTSEAGEGSKTALPIFGEFMERVYKDPSTKITQGRFPKASVKIEKKYYCPNAWPKKADSTQVDSTIVEDAAEIL